MRPGLRTPLLVVITRTQPADSWRIMERMKRGSSVEVLAREVTAERSCVVSRGVLLGPQVELAQDWPRGV